MWRTPLLPDAFRQVFVPPPDDPIWKWAGYSVWLEKKEAAESGYYRSAKTIWTRRIQEVGRDPRMFVVDYSDPENPVWAVVSVNEFNAKKSSQSGFTEALLNIIRWYAKYAPRNMIYTIDTREGELQLKVKEMRSLTKAA